MKGLAHNAAWNVVTGLSSALMTVVMPPILVRIIDGPSFGVWAVALQIASYVTILNLGVNTVIARHVAAVTAVKDMRARDSVTATAFTVLVGIAAVQFLGISGVAFIAPWLFPEAPAALHTSLTITICLLGFGLAIQLPVSTFSAVFVGIQRNDISGLGLISLRLLLLGCVILAALLTFDIRIMALAWVAATVMGSAIMIGLWKRHLEAPRFSLADASATEARKFAIDGLPFLLWNFSFLMVTGLQVAVVGRYAYPEVVPFVTAAGFATLIPGIQQAICGTLVARVSHDLATGNQAGIRRALDQVTFLSVLLGALLTIALIAGAHVVMRLALSDLYTPQSAVILALVSLAVMARNLLAAYVTAAVGCRLDKKLLINPIVEGIAALTLSYYLTPRYGAAGAAAGMLAGAVLLSALQIGQNALGSVIVAFRMSTYVRQILRTVMGVAVAIIGFAWMHAIGAQDFFSGAAVAAAALLVTAAVNLRLLKALRSGQTVSR